MIKILICLFIVNYVKGILMLKGTFSLKSVGLILLGAFLYSVVGSIVKLIFLGIFTYAVIKFVVFLMKPSCKGEYAC